LTVDDISEVRLLGVVEAGLAASANDAHGKIMT
jgi:hypothetical protein